MLGYILLPTFIVMLAIIGFKEDWKKVLKILGFWLGSFILMAIVDVALGIKPGSPTFNVVSLLLWGIWILGLIFYNIKEGHIGKF